MLHPHQHPKDDDDDADRTQDTVMKWAGKDKKLLACSHHHHTRVEGRKKKWILNRGVSPFVENQSVKFKHHRTRGSHRQRQLNRSPEQRSRARTGVDGFGYLGKHFYAVTSHGVKFWVGNFWNLKLLCSIFEIFNFKKFNQIKKCSKLLFFEGPGKIIHNQISREVFLDWFCWFFRLFLLELAAAQNQNQQLSLAGLFPLITTKLI